MQGIENKRILGLIQGTALGDSFGMPTEMMTLEKIREHGKITEMLPSFDDSVISRNQPAGSITDDTCHSLMIMQMLKQNHGKVNVQNYIDTLLQWRKNSPIAQFVTGPSTEKALNLIQQGVPVEQTGKMGSTNGCCMKIAPLGIYYDYQNKESLVKATAEICLPTHNTTIAIQGASSIVCASNYLLTGHYDFEEMMENVYECINIAGKYGYQWPSASLIYRIKKALSIVDETDNDDDDLKWRLYNEIGTSFETIDTVPVVFALLKKSQFDIYRFCFLSSSVGGDTDTIGAIGAALCGAAYPEKIKEKDIRRIQKVNHLDFSKMI